MRTRVAARAWLAVALVSAPAFGNPAAALREGDRAMESLDYNRAIGFFQRAVNDPEASPADLVVAYGALVRCQIVLDHESSARQAAAQLLQIDPGATLEGGSVPPRVTRFLEAFKDAFQGAIDVTISVQLPDVIVAGETLPIRARVTSGARAVNGLTIFMAFGPGSTYSSAELRRRERSWAGTLTVPTGFQPDRQEIRYYLEASSVSGTILGGLGTAEEPMTVAPRGGGWSAEVVPPVEHPGETPHPPHGPTTPEHHAGITGQWWFWTGIAVVVLGGGIAAIVVTGDSATPARTGNLVLPLP